MSSKYLGETFDIHGGGMDLQATHHTNEIAQSQACNHKAPVKYWMHTNMLTVNGVRMSKSAGNGFLPGELFTGKHPLLEKAYSPMTVRFFMMQSHYRSTLDFSNEALQASEKGYQRLMSSYALLEKLNASATSTTDIQALEKKCLAAMSDDLNSPVLIAQLFECARVIQSVHAGSETISTTDLDLLKKIMKEFLFDVLGLQNDTQANTEIVGDVVNLVLAIRNDAKSKKDFATSDKIRDELNKIKIEIKDTKDGTSWSIAQ
jgi:cysteinyl-tRNA synthetase